LHPAACDACWLYRAPRIGMCADSCTRWSFFAFVLLGFVQRTNCRGGRTSEFGHGQSACVLLDVNIQWVTMRIYLAQRALEHAHGCVPGRQNEGFKTFMWRPSALFCSDRCFCWLSWSVRAQKFMWHHAPVVGTVDERLERLKHSYRRHQRRVLLQVSNANLK